MNTSFDLNWMKSRFITYAGRNMQIKVHEQENSNFLNKNVLISCFNSILKYTPN